MSYNTVVLVIRITLRDECSKTVFLLWGKRTYNITIVREDNGSFEYTTLQLHLQDCVIVSHILWCDCYRKTLLAINQLIKLPTFILFVNEYVTP